MDNTLATNEKPYYYGFGGWLYFLVITQLYSVFITSNGISNWMYYISSEDISTLRTNGYNDYADRLAIVGVTGLIYSIFLIGIIVLSWFFLIRVSRMYKTTNIILIFGNFIISAILAVLMYYVNYYTAEEVFPNTELIKVIIGSIVFGIIWLPYFLKSARVANTFTK